MIKKVKQLAIFLENKPGVLFELTKDLADHKINIVALTVSDTIDHTVLRIIVDKPNEAIYLLENTGAIVIEKQVLLISVDNKPGILNKISAALSEKKQNIEYLYCSSGIKQKKGSIVIRTKNIDKTYDIIKNIKF
jgi:hypothetical protein